jgi:predicted flap endonuclease-1-like 5' DNA nuclease
MDIWVWLLIAAAFGGAIGWALHMMYLQRQAEAPAAAPAENAAAEAAAAARLVELEALLAKSTVEIDDLRQRSGIPAAGQEGAAIIEGSLAWRNRHLESRVRFLEGKLADVESDGARVRPAEDQNDEATRLRWRNRYLEGRVKYLEEELVRTGGLTPSRVASAPSAQPDPSAAKGKALEGDKPELIEQPRERGADDLKLISGIGPKLEQKLNSIGIWHYDQVASWTQANVDWVNAAISFRGRIEREKWVQQARQLHQVAEPPLETESETNSV